MESTRWAVIPGFDDFYSVSDGGHVRLNKDRLPRHAGDLLTLRRHSNAESGVIAQMSHAGKQKSYLVHRLVAAAFLPAGEAGQIVSHIDGDVTNNRATNLKWSYRHESTGPRAAPIDERGVEWRPVDGYEDYDVSELGEVRRAVSGAHSRSGAVMANQRGPNGYLCVSLRRDGSSRTMLVHRLVAAAFLSRKQEQTDVNHKNGDRTDPRASNLEFVTHAENMQHAQYVLGSIGKLTKEDANEIISRYNNEDRQVDIAKDYGVSQNQVSMIVLGKSWKNAGGKANRVAHRDIPIPDPGPEEWRSVASCPLAEVSNYGGIRWKANGQPISTSNSAGYRHRKMADGIGGCRSYKIHRLVAEAFLPRPAPGCEFVNHKNGKRDDNRVTNLEYVTPVNNMRHRYGYSYTEKSNQPDRP